ncbi:MAG: hypothetical protein ACFFCI_24280 [Promethearchaeota archaeon]
MKDVLAEKLLAKVMDWSPEEIARERADLEVMAKYKYNTYQQFSPGMRFIESLAQWLHQFDESDRRIAYNFIKNRLLFVSGPEMDQLVSIAYPDVIMPILIKETAESIKCPVYRVSKIYNSQEFHVLRRQSLFLGLSDGAHIDLFRRANRRELSNEQISALYDVSEDKAKEFRQELKKDISDIIGRDPENGLCSFKNLFLLDDFSGSGRSCLRREIYEFKGKLAKIHKMVGEHSKMFSANLLICIIMYICTQQAIEYLVPLLDGLFDNHFRYELVCIKRISENTKIQEGKDAEFIRLMDKYYDSAVETKHTEVGGTKDVKFGFANCGLPLVLSHNTPNNSVFLLWSYENLKIRGLINPLVL